MTVATEVVRLSLQVAVPAASAADIPAREQFSRWVNAAFSAVDSALPEEPCVTVRLVDAEEGARFNERYRGLQHPTNVLAFPAGDRSVVGAFDADEELGDLLICWPVVQAEAAEQGKSCTAHLAHLTVHGTLHLLGYDHGEPAAAATMEGLEQRIMRDLEFSNPYETDA